MGKLDTRHLVDPHLLPLLDAFPTVVLTAESLKEMRERALPPPPAEPCGVVLERRRVAGPPGAPDVGLGIFRPEAGEGPRGCIYHIHGGGYVGGSVEEFAFHLTPLAAALGCVIVSVDYRLSPEWRFPAAIEDCYAGLAWTIAHAGELGIDPARIGVMGESAGGGIAAALALMARDRGEYGLAFQHLTYPMIDDRTCVRPPHPVTGEFVWPAHNNHFGWSAYLGREPGGDDVPAYAAAARAADLTGLPPAYVMVGGLDLFLEENIDYARRLMAAGVATELHVYPGAFHGFDLMPGPPVAEQARAARLSALSRALG